MGRTLLIGTDTGNWREKIAYSEAPKKKGAKVEPKTVSIRSAIDLVDSDFPNSIACTSKFSPWNGQSWVATADGDSAVMHSDTGKPEFALPLLISALWDELKDKDVLKVAVSVPRKDLLGDTIADALNGTHTFTRNSVTKAIDVEVLNTFHEGVGVILHEKPESKNTYLLEIGGGTINASAFQRLKAACPPYIMQNAGGRCLIAEIRNCEEAVRWTGRAEGLSLAAATTILESPDHTITLASGTYDFSEAIDREANKWLDRVLTDINQRTKHHLELTDTKLASGGSCLVYAVAQRLEAEGFTIVKDPLWANAMGLHARAVWMHEQAQVVTAA